MEVSGPTMTMPGHVLNPPEGTTCDDHPNVPASHRVQGETDSMGAEWNDMCEACFRAYREEVRKLRAAPAWCSGCNSEKTDVGPIRMFDEGLAGPVYYRCTDCRIRIRRREEEDCGGFD